MSDFFGLSVFIFNLLLALAYFYIFGCFLSALKKNNRNDWDKIGQPSLFFNNSFGNMSKAISYILRREYRTSYSKKVVNLGASTRLFFLLFFLSLFVSFLIVLWFEVIK